MSKEIKSDNSEISRDFRICKVSVSPIRSKPKDDSEMVSQVLFGEMVELIGKRAKNWIKVRCLWDDYIGWCDPKQFDEISEAEVEKVQSNHSINLELVQPVISDQKSFPITIGANLPLYDGISFKLNGDKYLFSGQAVEANESIRTEEFVTKLSRKFLHAPYLWGGRSSFGIDCSGFTQIVYKVLGINLPRDAKDQIYEGEAVDFVMNAKIGDLAFFENKEGRIHHVGILLANNKIIHASGMVRIDNFDHFGIYQKNRRKYSHKLRIIKRLINFKPTLEDPTD